jgi:hypothetical protein
VSAPSLLEQGSEEQGSEEHEGGAEHEFLLARLSITFLIIA